MNEERRPFLDDRSEKEDARLKVPGDENGRN
jgi:hypothetical protein